MSESIREVYDNDFEQVCCDRTGRCWAMGEAGLSAGSIST